MDVVVNTLSSNLNLSGEAILDALLKAAGPQLQVLLNQQVTGSANNGAVFETAGGNLKNKLVFHAVVPHWNQGQGNDQKVIRIDWFLVISNLKIDAFNYVFIFFEQVLEDIVDKCLGLAEQRQQSSILFSAIGTGILRFPKPLVVCNMLDSAFKFSSKRSSKHVKEVVFVLHPKDAKTIQVFTDEFSKRFLGQSASTSASNPTQPQSTGAQTILLIQNIFKTEKIKTNLILNVQGVSKAILDKAGPNVEAECQQLGEKHGKKDQKVKKIIHISAQSNALIIQKHVKKALEMCAKEKLTAIAFPAIGTGGLSPGQVADSMMDVMLEMIRKNPQSTLKLIRLVVFQAQMLPEFHKSMQNQETGPAKQEQSTWSKIKRYDHATNDMINQEQVFQSITDTVILTLSDKDKERIQDRLEYKAHKGSEETPGQAKLTVQGLSRDVLKRMLQKEMNYTSELVIGSMNKNYKHFDQCTNFDLEKALDRQAADIRISFQGQIYQVTLCFSPLATEDIPQHWNAMLCKKFNLQPTRVRIYVCIYLYFSIRSTGPNIIERIQNPAMWKKYQNNKRVLEKRMFIKTMRKDFHGTSEQTISHIEKSGFKSQLCRKNAAVYGNVLTGDYTKGAGGMIVPPAKNANCDPYDTVVDNPNAPTIFVVFRDDNAYPEYLITFT
uniref:Si:ch211-219a4.3 n=1 Tax=Sinocyclocheilus grahami TaxID=75366 RepID=A0A672RD52_SINGR